MRRRDFYRNEEVAEGNTEPPAAFSEAPAKVHERPIYRWRGNERGYVKTVHTTPDPTRPGYCDICGKHIGRGINFHRKACAKKRDADA